MTIDRETTVELELALKSTEKKVVRVTFPIYSEHEMDACTVYARTDANFIKYCIWIWDGASTPTQLEIESITLDGGDYALGKGIYASSAEKFEKARKQFIDTAKAVLGRDDVAGAEDDPESPLHRSGFR